MFSGIMSKGVWTGGFRYGYFYSTIMFEFRLERSISLISDKIFWSKKYLILELITLFILVLDIIL